LSPRKDALKKKEIEREAAEVVDPQRRFGDKDLPPEQKISPARIVPLGG